MLHSVRNTVMIHTKLIQVSLASYSCGATDSGVFPSVIDGMTTTDCGFQACPGLRPEAATDEDRSSNALCRSRKKSD